MPDSACTSSAWAAPPSIRRRSIGTGIGTGSWRRSRRLGQAGVGFLCLPELCISGYGCEDAFLSPGVQRTAWNVLQEIVPQTTGLAVALGLPVRHGSGVYDAVAVVVDGRLAGLACKQHLAGDGIHYEPRWFRPWPGAGGRCSGSRPVICRLATCGLISAGPDRV